VVTLSRNKEARKPSPDAMTLTEHLGELRRRLVICAVAFTIGAVISYILYNWILHILTTPYCNIRPHSCQLYITAPLQGFGLRLDVAAYGGLFLALPVILWQLWRFVTPGLKANEKKYALPFVASTLILFTIGALVAYETFPHALGFLISVGGSHLQEIFSPNSYLQLILLLMLAFGLAFEFPAVLVGLEMANVLTPAKLSSWRRPAIIAMVIFAAVATPSSDPFSMLALAIPLLLFYEMAIVIGKVLERQRVRSRRRP
jgi:sec-independent protein translocase protein TatC